MARRTPFRDLRRQGIAVITGPSGYILKPFDDRELATQIDLALHKHAADQQIREQREMLRVTLTSIGDAVMATDTQGRVTFANPVAESLTGWPMEEAVGKPLEKVIRIVDEHTGAVIDSPVKKVLATGQIVALANHTVLLSKNGG